VSPTDIVSERVPPVPQRLEEARLLRKQALERCRERAFEDCIRGLDKARALDPIGDEAEAIQSARAAARATQSPEPPNEPLPDPSAAPAPSPSTAPSARDDDSKSAPRRRTSPTSEAPEPKPPEVKRGNQK
jgi:hypothetical protein